MDEIRIHLDNVEVSLSAAELREVCTGRLGPLAQAILAAAFVTPNSCEQGPPVARGTRFP